MNNKYRLNGRYLLLSIIAALVTLSMTTGAIILMVVTTSLLLIGSSSPDWPVINLIPLVMVCGTLGLSVGFLIVIGVVIPLGNALFSYLRVGSTGLELRSWPTYRLRCDWSQVTGIEQVKIFGGHSLSMLRFKEGEVVSWPGVLGKPGPYYVPFGSRSHSLQLNPYLSLLIPLSILFFAWPGKDKNLVPVFLFKGWPDGKLRQDLESRLGPISLD